MPEKGKPVDLKQLKQARKAWQEKREEMRKQITEGGSFTFEKAKEGQQGEKDVITVTGSATALKQSASEKDNIVIFVGHAGGEGTGLRGLTGDVVTAKDILKSISDNKTSAQAMVLMRCFSEDVAEALNVAVPAYGTEAGGFIAVNSADLIGFIKDIHKGKGEQGIQTAISNYNQGVAEKNKKNQEAYERGYTRQKPTVYSRLTRGDGE